MSNFDQKTITGVAALLVHVAKIDEKYSSDEKKLITDFIKSYIQDINSEEILKKAEEIESSSNQLLSFTNILKKNSNEFKSNIIEHLWKIIISDDTIDQYESNLMRRICGLIYFSDKMSGEIKLKLLNKK
tara:strand:- start:814 stop:1203 length:390 start_codon:yes stop_codon:yes gene_type:complete